MSTYEGKSWREPKDVEPEQIQEDQQSIPIEMDEAIPDLNPAEGMLYAVLLDFEITSNTEHKPNEITAKTIDGLAVNKAEKKIQTGGRSNQFTIAAPKFASLVVEVNERDRLELTIEADKVVIENRTSDHLKLTGARVHLLRAGNLGGVSESYNLTGQPLPMGEAEAAPQSVAGYTEVKPGAPVTHQPGTVEADVQKVSHYPHNPLRNMGHLRKKK